MKKRRYREKTPQIFVCSIHANRRIHDFLKGWGTVCEDNSILWDHWRPVPKRLLRKKKLVGNFDKFKMPMIKRQLPELKASDLLPDIIMKEITEVQPMNVDITPLFNKQ